jgi:hypothetical protein
MEKNKTISVEGIRVADDGTPYIRDTNITVGDILDDCWDSEGDGSNYKYREIIDTCARRGATITYEDLGNARQYAMLVLSKR